MKQVARSTKIIPRELRLAALVLLVVLLCACAPIGRGYEAALVLGDMAAGGEDSALKNRTPEPQRREIRYRIDDREYIADLYRPGDGEEPGAALVLIHGFSEYGKNDPRLVEFAETLSRARFNVLVPDITNLREFQVQPEDSRDIADAVRFLIENPELTPDGRIGAGAISYAVGPMLLAALEPAVAPELDFVIAIGGYYDIEPAITFITTGYDPLTGEQHQQPPPVARWQFLTSYLHRLEDPDDRALLEQIAERRADNPHANVDDLVGELGDEGLNVFELLTNQDPARVPELLGRLPDGIREEIAELDLANAPLQRLQAHLLLVHGRDDPIIPPSHSEALAATLPPGQTTLHLVTGITHVDVDPGFIDGIRLWRVAYSILSLRDQG